MREPDSSRITRPEIQEIGDPRGSIEDLSAPYLTLFIKNVMRMKPKKVQDFFCTQWFQVYSCIQ